MAAVAPPLQWCVPIIDCELIHAFVCHCMLDLAKAMRYEPPMPDPFTLFTQWSGPMMRVREVCYLANNKHNYERTIFLQSSMQLCIYFMLLCWVALGVFCFASFALCSRMNNNEISQTILYQDYEEMQGFVNHWFGCGPLVYDHPDNFTWGCDLWQRQPKQLCHSS